MVWRDIDEPTLAQAFDAWGKGVQQLDIPPQAVWSKLPGVTPREAERWQEVAAQYPREADLIAQALTRQADGDFT